VDVGALVRYVAATALQWALMVGALWALQCVTAVPALPTWAPKTLVAVFFAFISLKSRVFSPLDNSRPTITKVRNRSLLLEGGSSGSCLPVHLRAAGNVAEIGVPAPQAYFLRDVRRESCNFLPKLSSHSPDAHRDRTASG
jgi:hypothetical protein